jgi:hypothetical protein
MPDLVLAFALFHLPFLLVPETLAVSSRPWVNPIGLPLVIGTFVFDVGMQLSGGCGSGLVRLAATLDSRHLVGLGCFVVGSVGGGISYDGGWGLWTEEPSGVSLVKEMQQKVLVCYPTSCVFSCICASGGNHRPPSTTPCSTWKGGCVGLGTGSHREWHPVQLIMY